MTSTVVEEHSPPHMVLLDGGVKGLGDFAVLWGNKPYFVADVNSRVFYTF